MKRFIRYLSLFSLALCLSACATAPPTDAARLQALRGEIDVVDQQLVGLIAQRIEIARKIGEVKRALHKPIIDPKREAEVIRQFVNKASVQGIEQQAATDIIKRLIAAARASEH